jgi:hypothetical protein
VLMVPFEANFYFVCPSSKCEISNSILGKLKKSFVLQVNWKIHKFLSSIIDPYWKQKAFRFYDLNLKESENICQWDFSRYIVSLSLETEKNKGKNQIGKSNSHLQCTFLFYFMRKNWFLLKYGKYIVTKLLLETTFYL